MEGAVRDDRFREGTAPILFDFCLLHCKYVFFFFIILMLSQNVVVFRCKVEKCIMTHLRILGIKNILRD